VELLEHLGVAAWKVASGELTNLAMVAAMAQTGKPVMLSTGMSPMTEIGAAVAVVQAHAAPFAIFQCTTQYPSPPEAIGLNVLDTLRQRFAAAVGLSDHSATIYPGLAAVAAHGAELIEVHLTLSRAQFGPDVVASLTPEELQTLVDGVRFIERMKAHPLDKTSIDPRVAPLRDIFFKSVVALEDLPAGTVLARHHLGLKKPGTGIPASALEATIGRVLKRAVKRDDILQPEDVQ
jgi:N-acetylneuraminate synthase